MIHKIIILDPNIFNKLDYDKYGIGTLKKNGFEVEYWCMRCFITDIELLADEKSSIYDWEGRKYIRDLTHFKDEIKLVDRKKTFFVNRLALVTYNSDVMRLYAVLRIYRIKYSVMYNKSIPQEIVYPKKDIHYFLNPHNIKNFMLEQVLYNPICNFMPTKHYKTNVIKKKNIHNVLIHDFDYDRHYDYLKKAKKHKVLTHDNYAVFFDGYAPFHPDYKIYKYKCPVTNIDQYYKELCDLFDTIEQQFNCDVIIAAHPRADYTDKKDYYQGRKIEYFKTIDLVEKCKFAITAGSAATNFLVICNKPAIFIADNQTRLLKQGDEVVRGFLKQLNKNAINISKDYHSVDFEKELKIDQEAYKRYKEIHIKSEDSKNLSTWEIVARYVKSLNHDR